MSKKKILVGVVTSNYKDYCWDKFKKQLKGLQLQGCDVYICDNSQRTTNRKGFKVWHYDFVKNLTTLKSVSTSGANYLTYVTRDCMNELRRYFLNGDYTHLFILESDVFIAPNSLDRLLSMNSDVANFTYMMNLERFEENSACVQSTDENGNSKMITPEETKELLNTGIKILGKDKLNGKTLTHCGYGCTLVRREVLEKIEFKTAFTKHLDKVINPFPDSYFHKDVNDLGFSNKLDTDYLPTHLNLNNETAMQMAIVNTQLKTSRRDRRRKR